MTGRTPAEAVRDAFVSGCVRRGITASQAVTSPGRDSGLLWGELADAAIEAASALAVPELRIAPCPADGHDGEHLQARTGAAWLCAERLAAALAVNGVTADPAIAAANRDPTGQVAGQGRVIERLTADLSATNALVADLRECLLQGGQDAGDVRRRALGIIERAGFATWEVPAHDGREGC